MSQVKIKNLPPIRLADLLRKRRMTLKQFTQERCILTYDALVRECDRMGVAPPDVKDFPVYVPEISNQQEGVVVLEPPAPEKQRKKKLTERVQRALEETNDHAIVDQGGESEK